MNATEKEQSQGPFLLHLPDSQSSKTQEISEVRKRGKAGKWSWDGKAPPGE